MSGKNEQTITIAIESQEAVVSEIGASAIGVHESDQMMMGTFDSRYGAQSEEPIQPISSLEAQRVADPATTRNFMQDRVLAINAEVGLPGSTTRKVRKFMMLATFFSLVFDHASFHLLVSDCCYYYFDDQDILAGETSLSTKEVDVTKRKRGGKKTQFVPRQPVKVLRMADYFNP